MTFVFLSIFFVIISCAILYYDAKKIKNCKTKQLINLTNQGKEIIIKIQELQQQKSQLQEQVIDIKKSFNDRYTTIIKQNQQKLQQQQENLENKSQRFKVLSSQAADQWFLTLEQTYQEKQNQFDKKIEEMQKARAQVENALNQVKAELSAAAATQIKEREKIEKINFYKLQLTKAEEKDIIALDYVKNQLSRPDILCKYIWTSYFQKQTTDLCNRILGTEKKCGIYKITDLITKQIYIGQSLDISRRFKQHIKCGLGIDTPATNVLYRAMLKDGIVNFTFELVQECTPQKLNERERFWIEIYSSDKVGMNTTKGNK